MVQKYKNMTNKCKTTVSFLMRLRYMKRIYLGRIVSDHQKNPSH